MKKMLKFMPVFLICFSSFAMEQQYRARVSEFVLWQIAQRITQLEEEGKKVRPATRQERVAELKKIHEKFLQNPSLKSKFQKNRQIFAIQDTPLSHHGHRK